MDRIGGANWIYDGSGKRVFTDGPPATTVPATWLTGVQEEIATVIEAAGITTSVNDNTQLLQAMRAGVANLAMTGEASATSATSPVTLDLGTVTTGDRIFVTVSASLSLATNANYAYVIAEKSSGTATITLQNGYSRLSNLASGSSASGIAIEGLPTVSGIMQVTAGGTLVIKGTCAGSPTSLSSVSIYAFFLKKQ